MSTTWHHARAIAEPLADSLARLEVRLSPGLRVDRVREAVILTWDAVVADGENGRSNLSSDYLAALHKSLATAAGAAAAGEFADSGLPLLDGGCRTSWAGYVAECSADGEIEPAWVLAQLRWGDHVRSMQLSLGWLAMNIVLLSTLECAIYPPPPDHERLMEYLAYAGPDDHDAEGLRALIWKYVQSQRPSPGTAGIP
jgi:hypothetical protein